MYIYFDSQGVLKEIINDQAIRQGNDGINTIHFFIEGRSPQIVDGVYKALHFTSGVRTFIDTNGNALTTEQFSIATSQLEVPYNKKRELKYFKYFTKYEMFTISLPQDLLNESGVVGCRIQMINGSEITTLGLVVFNVENTGTELVIGPDTAISIAEWNYLISNMLTLDSFTNHELENFVKSVIADETDSEVQEDSTNPVQSGAVATALDGLHATIQNELSDVARKGVETPPEGQPGDPYYAFTFDSNGEITIDLEYMTIADGLYWVTYGNAQTFLFITQAMIAISTDNPIRVSMPCIYSGNGSTHTGTLRIWKVADSTLLKFRIQDDDGNRVPQNFQIKFYKTKLM